MHRIRVLVCTLYLVVSTVNATWAFDNAGVTPTFSETSRAYIPGNQEQSEPDNAKAAGMPGAGVRRTTPPMTAPPRESAMIGLSSPANPPAQLVLPDGQALANLRRLINSVGNVGWDPVGTAVFVPSSARLLELSEKGTVITPGAGATFPSSAFSAPELMNHVYPISFDEISVLSELLCRFIVQRVYKRGHRYIVVQAFEFDSNLGANGGYHFLRKGSTTVNVRGDGSSEDIQTLSFWQGRHFFRVIGTSEDDDESKEVSGSLAEQISNLYGSHAALPAVLARLPVIDRVKGSEKIVMGPVLTKKYLAIPFVSLLAIEKSNGGAVADFQLFQPTRERLKALYVEYKDANFAGRLFDNYYSQLSALHKSEGMQAGGEPRFIFKLNKRYLYCELKGGTRLLIISGATKRYSPAMLARQFR